MPRMTSVLVLGRWKRKRMLCVADYVFEAAWGPGMLCSLLWSPFLHNRHILRWFPLPTTMKDVWPRLSDQLYPLYLKEGQFLSSGFEVWYGILRLCSKMCGLVSFGLFCLILHRLAIFQSEDVWELMACSYY